MVTGEAIHIGKILVKSYAQLIDINLWFIIVVDSKEIFTTLFTQRQSIDMSIRGDVSVIWFKYKKKALLNIVFGPRKLNLAGTGTKLDGLLNDALLHLLQSPFLLFELEDRESKSSNHPFGYATVESQREVNTVVHRDRDIIPRRCNVIVVLYWLKVRR